MRTSRFTAASLERYLDRQPEKYPRPLHVGLAPTHLQLALLHRLYTAPHPVVWDGFAHNRPTAAYCRDLPHAPGLHSQWLRGLWNSGLIECSPDPEVIVVAIRGLPLLNDRYLANERRRWTAVSVLSAALVQKHAAYWSTPPAEREATKPPPRQMTSGMIQTVMLALGRGDERIGATA